MEFSPSNNVVKLCLRGMEMGGNGRPDEASRLFQQAWKEATNDFERFTAAYCVARHQGDPRNKLEWLETSLKFAARINDAAVSAAFPGLHSDIAQCYEDLGDVENAARN